MIAFPAIGFGTADLPFGGSPGTVRESVLHAIKLGYRRFDTASVYKSEEPLGDAVADAVRLGLIESRDDLFISTKLSPADCHRDRVLPALRKSLRNLKMEYVDLFLIHMPVSSRPGSYGAEFTNDWDLLPMNFKSVWEGMEECKDPAGLSKHIGVSNFSCNKLHNLLATANIPPLINQVEMNPLWQQKKLREYCEKRGIYITAYSPLGAKGTFWGSNRVMECEVLKDIARAKGKSVAQICMRWVYEQGVSMLVKSFNKERMQQNIDIFDWSLMLEESEKIAQIPQRKGFRGIELISEKGPYKSLKELWDEDVS